MGFSDFMKWLWSSRLPENIVHKKRLSLLYAIVTWHAVLLAYYKMCKDKDYVTTEGQKAVLMNFQKQNNENVQNIVIRGFTVVKNEMCDTTQDETKHEKLVG